MPHRLELKAKSRTNQRHRIFKHRYITQPTLTPEDQMIQSIRCLHNLIEQWTNKKGKVDINAIKELSSIIGTDATNNAIAPRVRNATAPIVQKQAAIPRVSEETVLP